jgi:hypothetical protein
MCQQQFQAEVSDEEEILAVRLNTTDDLFNLMVAMNRAYLEQMEADMEPHKRSGYLEQMCEQADMRRKEKRENGYE